MAIKDYKAKDAGITLGLNRGKAAIKRETSSKTITPGRVFRWLGLFGLVVLVNYLFFVHLGPLKEKEIKIAPTLTGHKRSNTFEKWFDKGYKRYQEGDLAGAVEAYTEAIILRPEEIRSYFNRGIVYIEIGKQDKALDDYNKVIILNPDYAKAYNNRGWAYFKKGLFDLAIQDCTQAIILDPNMATAYHTRGMAYEGKGLFDIARNDFQKSCELGDLNGCRAYGELSRPRDED
jgi:tetratricopeptide (TPR) repeat protein